MFVFGFVFEPLAKEARRLSGCVLLGVFADLKAEEAADGELVAYFLADGGDVVFEDDFAVADESLFFEADALAVFFNLALDDSGNGLWGFSAGLFAGDFLFFLEKLGRDFGAADNYGAGGGDLKGDVFDETGEAFVADAGGMVGTNFGQNADFGSGVDVGGDEADAGNIHSGVPPNLDVFADFGDVFGAQGFDVRLRSFDEGLGDLIAELSEHFVFGDKVGFAVDFDKDAGLRIGANATGDGAFVGGASGFFGGAGGAFFSKNVDGRFQIAVGFRQGSFAVHDSRIGHCPKLGYGGCANFCHISI